MKHRRFGMQLTSLVALALLPGMASVVNAQGSINSQRDRPTFSKEDIERAKSNANKAAAPTKALGCRGPITQVLDVGDEDLRFTSANYFSNPGGGEGGGFDKTPILSTKVQLMNGTCLNAHFSGIAGGRIYGVAPLTMFQVTLTPATGGPPRHMVGHYEQPYGTANGAAVFLEAESDADVFGSNFFQKVGTGTHEVPPGAYRVDVWWSGAGPGGAIGAAFVLKLYMR
ncbi:MAG: hypothetical protein H7Z16_07020 [Pyrinomonadaceae bacterium]|nr:hypothetical protein [Pyrinomonadaceae bacterium]